MAVKPPNSADSPDSAHSQCPDEHGNKADCTVVTTKAAVDQAKYSGEQAGAAIASVAIGGFTLIAASLAAYFAKKAADWTGDNAKAAKAAVDVAKEGNLTAKEASAPRVVISLGGFDDPRKAALGLESVFFNIVASNIGGSGCVIEGIAHAWYGMEEEVVIFSGTNVVFPINPGQSVAIAEVIVPKKNLANRQVLRGIYKAIGPTMGEKGIAGRFSFRVFPEMTYPHLSHYHSVSTLWKVREIDA